MLGSDSERISIMNRFRLIAIKMQSIMSQLGSRKSDENKSLKFGLLIGSKVKNYDIKIGAAAQKSQIIIFIQKSLIMKMLSLFSSAVKDQDYGCFLLF